MLASDNPNIMMDDILAHRDLPWDWQRVSVRPDLKWEDVQANLTTIPWDVTSLWCDRHEMVTHVLDAGMPVDDWEDISLWVTPDKPWVASSLLCNQNFTWDIISGLPMDGELDMYSLSTNPNLTYDIIRDNPRVAWDFRGLSYNDFNRNTVVHDRCAQSLRDLLMGCQEMSQLPVELIDMMIDIL